MADTALIGRWWRWTSYELRRGYLRRSPGATLEPYYPVDSHWEQRRGRREDAPAYATLIGLADRVVRDSSGRLGAEDAAAVVQWCDQYGLLGILLHQVQEVRLAPFWKRPAATHAPKDGSSHEAGAKARRLQLTQTVYTRIGTGIVRKISKRHPVFLEEGQARAGEVADERYWATSPPVAYLRKLATDEWTMEPLTDTWARYFPTIRTGQRSTYRYPAPYSDRFWELYAEPAEDFILAAERLRKAILTPDAFGKDEFDPMEYPLHLNSLVAPAGPALIGTDGNYEQRLVSPSLFSSLVLMAEIDLAGHQRIIRCGNDRCRQLILASSYQTAYCSLQCKYAVNKRRARARTGSPAGRRVRN
jgi:hypothetical protein